MIKERHFSTHQDFKTGIFFKISILLGIILLIFYIILLLIHNLTEKTDSGLISIIQKLANSSIAETILAFAIIFIGLGLISYFFYIQFSKLSKITDEIEKIEEDDEIEW
ncbi:MAG: hypothetical protein JXA91_07285 [Candidatus Thermoplasmatota archaeon]|nr:hypothetical protein [Candidatus Thermoplasmatota archaeon]